MEQEITIKVDIPEGYEATGEFRHARIDEHYLNVYAEVGTSGGEDTAGQYIILRKMCCWSRDCFRAECHRREEREEA